MDPKEQYDHYRTKSKDELMDTLFSLTQEQKANGELDNARMEEFFTMLSPMLSDDQRQRMRRVLEQLKQ